MSSGYWVISPLPLPTLEQVRHADLETLGNAANTLWGGTDEAVDDPDAPPSPDGTPAWAIATKRRLMDGLRDLMAGESDHWDRVILGDRHYAIIVHGDHDESYHSDTLSALNEMPCHKEFWDKTNATWKEWNESQ